MTGEHRPHGGPAEAEPRGGTDGPAPHDGTDGPGPRDGTDGPGPRDGTDRPGSRGAELRRAGLNWRLDPGDRPGDPVCLLPWVCPACGAVAESDPPVTCPQCGGEIPGR